MTYTVKFLDTVKFLNSKLVSPAGDYYFSEIVASVPTGVLGMRVISSTLDSVVFETSASIVTARYTTTGIGLSAGPYGAGFVLNTGTVNKITVSFDFGSGFFNAYEISGLNLNSIATVQTVLNYATGVVSGGDQIILAGEGVRYFGTTANDVFTTETKGIFGETLSLDGDDYLVLGGGNDRFSAGKGNDTMLGEAGDDVLYGRSGNDLISGGGGRDKLIGNDGDDRLLGGLRDDTLIGGYGNDRLLGNKGGDTLYGDSGDDRLVGGAGNDFLRGAAGLDKLFGGNGSDILQGDYHKDELFGGRGKDTLYGGKHGDILTGGAGQDVLSGGTGSDVFVFDDTSGKDRISDYQVSIDKIQIDTTNEITTKVVSAGVRVFWGDESLLVIGVSDTADLDFL